MLPIAESPVSQENPGENHLAGGLLGCICCSGVRAGRKPPAIKVATLLSVFRLWWDLHVKKAAIATAEPTTPKASGIEGMQKGLQDLPRRRG